MIALNQKLKDLGIEQTIQLPQICVIGNQSTGKSSLVEALSMIKVPRDEGCCTRCPLEVNLINSKDVTQPWKCKIFLVQKYEYIRSGKVRVPSKNHPMGPWNELAKSEAVPFGETADKDDVYDLIVQAQAVILNPSLNSTTFINQHSKVEQRDVQFSPNIVRLDIVQHELPSLSFVDLPGLIQYEQEEYLVTLVENLVLQYTRNERSINLLTMSMTSDFNTSTALRVITQSKASSRTLAVMTKPDLFPEHASMKPFLDMLTGTKEPRMDHGYHVVMMDPNVQLDHAAAMRKELEYFSKNQRWAELGAEYRCKLGSQKLSGKLSILLQNATQHNLPASLLRIDAKLAKVNVHLDSLPKSPGQHFLPTVLSALIGDFAEHMHKLFGGGGDADTFKLKRGWDRQAELFRAKLMDTAPKLPLYTNDELARKKEAERALTTDKLKNNKNSTESSPEVISSDDDDEPAALSSIKKESTRENGAQPQSPNQFYHCFSFDEIRSINCKHALSGVPPQMFPEAVLEMMRLCVEHIHYPTNNFLDQTVKLVERHVVQHARLVFRQQLHLPLYNVVTDKVMSFLQSAGKSHHNECLRVFQMEQDMPCTWDNETCQSEANRIGNYLAQQRKEKIFNLEKSEHEASQLHKAKGQRRPYEFTLKTFPYKEEWHIEIQLMASVTAYHKIAASRFVDHICQSIHAKLFPLLSNDIARDLRDFLGPMKPEQQLQIQEWMTENPERLRRRNQLLREKQSLEEARVLVEDALDGDAKKSSSRAEKRKASAEDDIDMEGSSTEVGSDGESPTKKTKVKDVVGGLHSSVEEDMDES